VGAAQDDGTFAVSRMDSEDTTPATARPATILVAEDEEELRELYRRILTGAGYRVLLAPNGRHATRLIARETVDLVMTDLLMPEMDGVELIAWLRREGFGMPVLMVSGVNAVFKTDYLAVVRDLGASATLEKPVTGETLLGAIARLLHPEHTGSLPSAA
jgi:DNA-binding response OmpR family regulator